MTSQPHDKNRGAAPYQAFLVRLWQDGKDSLWRGSAQSVQTGEVTRFANLTELFAFLDVQTGEEPAAESRAGWGHHRKRQSTIQPANEATKEVM